MTKTFLYRFSIVVFATLSIWIMSATNNYSPAYTETNYLAIQPQEPDTLTGKLPYPIKESSGNPYLENEERSAIDLKMPDNIEYRTEYDPQTKQVTIYRKMGGIDVRLPYTMSLEEYLDVDTRSSILGYWYTRQQQEAGTGGGNSIYNRSLKLGVDAINSIFGNNLVDIRMQGIAELKIGIQHTKIDNPTLQERLRKTTTFDFEENIQMNITGNIGDKMKLGVNYNTQALFDFENQIKLEYTGDEDEIVKKIEAGNVTLPLPGTLITGSQSLFGIKTEMQFGRLMVTSIFSQQKGQSQVMNVEGGATKQEFELPIDQYDRNRHFFLSHAFRDNYNNALKDLPVINSPYNITQVEVWVTNRSGIFDESRNVVSFMDLGESGNNISNKTLWSDNPGNIPDNNTNNLYGEMTSTYNAIRDINQVSTTLQPLVANDFTSGKDYEKVENARKLLPTEYTINSKLGYISLNNSLQADEVLSVAYEYTYNGEVYRVGELISAGGKKDDALYLKLIKGTALTPNLNTWNLMMKNIYAIGAYQVSKEDFVFDVVYVNDSTGSQLNYFPEGEKPPTGINGELLIRVMDLDKLNSRDEPGPDGIFDFIEGYTIYPQNGRVIFPVNEPFGEDLAAKIKDQKLIDKYVFEELYTSSQTEASQLAEKNKFRLKGSYKSGSGSEISLNAMNIPQGGVIVTAGGIKLIENVDYTVDYTLGKVRIINQGYLESGTPIQVSTESQSLYNMQTKTLLGTHLDYKFSDKFNVGATIMHLSERPLTQKINIGDEPISNTIWGLNTSYSTQSMGITNLIDKLPLIQTKEPSTISFEGEFAQLIPGHPSVIKKEGTAYIDDFEGAKISYDQKNMLAWKLASTPQGQSLFPESSDINDLRYGFNRAKLAWYIIDPLFNRSSTETPRHIKDDKEQLSNHYVRIVDENELFPNKEAAIGQPTNIPILNLAYYPRERGPYNFDANIDANGFLNNPAQRWGGMMRKIETSDFEAANIESIEFWVMDPFVYNNAATKGGDLYFNLGNISEDILRDSRKSFEQGLPVLGEKTQVDSTAWGYVSSKTSLVNAFNNDPASRKLQDVGLDGLSSDQEKNDYSYKPAIENIKNIITSQAALNKILADPSSDNYHYYRGSDYDQAQTSILDRYKDYNNTEGNSVSSEYSPESYQTAAISTPDVEDINQDNTLSETENYFQYKVVLRPDSMEVGQNYITDIKLGEPIKLPNGKTEQVKWYQFKIPLTTDNKVGDIKDFRSIRFMRMFLNNCTDTLILRFASLDLVRGEWRKYTKNIFETLDNVSSNPNTQFEVSAVNIEENAGRANINYVLPPGIDRVIDPANPQIRQLNEQSLSLKVVDLAGRDARAVYKTLTVDMRQYKRLKMEVHAEQVPKTILDNGEVSAFIRIGSDYKDNFYEYEVPLKLTPYVEGGGVVKNAYIIWPTENQINIELDKLQQIKLRRNEEKRQAGSTITFNDLYTWNDPDNPLNYLKIKGNPNLGNIKTVMLGIKVRGNQSKSVEVWFNELRLTDFDESGGWAANARVRIDLADIGNISLAGKTSTAGFGSIDQSVNERSQENFYQYDIATNIEGGKLLGPQSRLSIPFYYGYSKAITTPKYYPLDPDIPLSIALDNTANASEKDSIKNLSQAVVERRSYNFTNIRLNPKENSKQTLVSPSNLSASYSYNEMQMHDINTEYSIDKDYRAILAYNYNGRPKLIEPFKKSKILANKAFSIIRDFNFYPLPAQIGYRWEFVRNYSETQTRNVANPAFLIPVTVQQDFSWNRYFDLNYPLTKSLRLDFKAMTNARIDEPQGPVNKRLYHDEYEIWKDSVMQNILSFGRLTNYTHTTNLNYTVPINKIPMLDWVNSTVRYGSMYQWTMGPQSSAQYDWGNIIRNSNSIQGTGQFNMTTLYNKSDYLKNLTRKYRNPQNKGKEADSKRTVRFNQENLVLEAGKPVTIDHKLNAMEVAVKVFDENGRPLQGETNVINKNKISFTPTTASSKARLLVTGTVTENNSVFQKVLDYSSLIITGIKNVSISYNQTNGTILPGYAPEAKFMGMSSYEGITAPGIPFAFGVQDRDFAIKAGENGWLTKDKSLNSPYIMTHSNDFNIKTTIEPIKGLRIDLTADRRYQRNMDEYYIYNDVSNNFEARNTMERGLFSMSFNTIGTSFWSIENKGAFYSKAYEKFLDNRTIIANRLGRERTGQLDPVKTASNGSDTPYLLSETSGSGVNGYNLSSQEVLIPAFLAAYSDRDANSIFLDPMPNILKMMPNWRVTYDGLSKIKLFKKFIRSFDITHAYLSTYSVGSYVTNLNYNNIGDGLSWIRDVQDNFTPKFDINSVTINEQFNPLVAFNITWVNSLNTRAEYKKSRLLNLSLSNNQLIESYTNEWVIGMGYRFDKLALKIGNKTFNSDLNLRADISIRDNISIIRRIEDLVDQLTSGQKIISVKFTGDYALSDRFNLQLFYDTNISNPYVSLSYPTTNTNFGLSFRFTLTQ